MNTYQEVKDYYGKILESTQSLKTSACTMSNRPPDIILDIMKKIPHEIKNKYYGRYEHSKLPDDLKDKYHSIDGKKGTAIIVNLSVDAKVDTLIFVSSIAAVGSTFKTAAKSN